MVTSEAERKRLYRKRKKEEAAAIRSIPQSPLFSPKAFTKFMAAAGTLDSDEALNFVGMDIPDFTEDVDFQTESGWWAETGTPKTALYRATAVVEIAIDFARELSGLINKFKLVEIDKRVSEIEKSDLSEPAAKKRALVEIVELAELRASLDRDVRHTFREIRGKSENLGGG